MRDERIAQLDECPVKLCKVGDRLAGSGDAFQGPEKPLPSHEGPGRNADHQQDADGEAEDRQMFFEGLVAHAIVIVREQVCDEPS